jgi:FkbH-like protein
MNESRIAVLSTFTADLFAESLVAHLAEKGMPASLYLSPFAQYQQMILQPDSELFTFKPDVFIMLLDGADLFGDVWDSPLDFTAEAGQMRVRDELATVAMLVEAITSRAPGCLVLVNDIFAPPVNGLGLLEGRIPGSLKPITHAYNAGLHELAARHPQLVAVDVEAVMTRVGYEVWFDDRLWYLAKMRLTALATEALGNVYATVIQAARGRIRKCLVLDLDNTLWGGVVGEEGVAGLRLGREGIGAAFRDFQKEILNLKKRGVVLALSSKNNQGDALEVFRNHPEMVLQWDDFAAVRIDWRDKSVHLRELSQELNIGLDTVVFVDDNPVERALVRSEVPEVTVVEMPSDPSYYRKTLLNLDLFATLSVTDEDRARPLEYRAQVQREQCRLQSPSLVDFYRSLKLSVRIGLATDFEIPRVAQLTQRTNQFNLTTRRYTDSEVRCFCNSPQHAVYVLHSQDRFGDNGLVGVAIVVKEDACWRVDTFLMSCRVLGRTLETAFFAVLMDDAGKAGVSDFQAEYIPTAKNAPAMEFLKKLGFVRLESEPYGWGVNLERVKVCVPEWVTVTRGIQDGGNSSEGGKTND